MCGRSWLAVNGFPKLKTQGSVPLLPECGSRPPAGQCVKAPTHCATTQSGWFVPGDAPGTDTQRALRRAWRGHSPRRLRGLPAQTTTPKRGAPFAGTRSFTACPEQNAEPILPGLRMPNATHMFSKPNLAENAAHVLLPVNATPTQAPNTAHFFAALTMLQPATTQPTLMVRQEPLPPHRARPDIQGAPRAESNAPGGAHLPRADDGAVCAELRSSSTPTMARPAAHPELTTGHTTARPAHPVATVVLPELFPVNLSQPLIELIGPFPFPFLAL